MCYKLKTILEQFSLERCGERECLTSGNALTTLQNPPVEFQSVAKSILNGYFLVRSGNESVCVHPTCVEIYYHEEQENGVKDPIVYHRNRKKKKGIQDTPAVFKIGVLHNHVSGIDITFEKEANSTNTNITGVVRASALIREFEVKDDKGQIIREEKHPTYLYQALFGQFSILDGGFSIMWVDGQEADFDNIELKWGVRKNVVEYQNNGYDYEKKPNKIQDKREWKFWKE